MSARWPRDRVLRDLARRCGLPDGPTVEAGRHGGLVYVDSGLVRRLRVYAAALGKLRWEVDVGDKALSRSDSAAFHTTYAVDDALVGGDGRRLDSRNWAGYSWPTTGTDLDDQLVEDVRQFAPRMLWFLSDRRELGLMMLRGDETTASSAVWRDGIQGRRWSGGAAALVHAVGPRPAGPMSGNASNPKDNQHRSRSPRRHRHYAHQSPISASSHRTRCAVRRPRPTLRRTAGVNKT